MSTATTQWTIDPSHTSLDFAVRHMAIATVRGRFKKVSGTLTATEDGTLAAIEAAIDAASIDTGDAQRDTHLRSGDFLDAEHYPVITFRSAKIEDRGDGRYLVTGDLTIRDESRRVAFEVEATDAVIDPWGNRRAGASGSGTLTRKEWGLTWNRVLDFGAVLVGEEVRFTLEVEAIAAKSHAA